MTDPNTRPTPALDEAGAKNTDSLLDMAVLRIRRAQVEPSASEHLDVALELLAARAQQPAAAERPRDTSAAVEGGSADRDTQGAQQPAAEVEAEAEMAHYLRATCACTAAQRHMPDCEKHGAAIRSQIGAT